MLRSSFAALCIAGLLAGSAGAQSDKPDIAEETPAYTIEANVPDQPGKIAGLRMWYPPYAVGAYAEGSFESFVPHRVFNGFLREDLKPLFGGRSGRKAQ